MGTAVETAGPKAAPAKAEMGVADFRALVGRSEQGDFEGGCRRVQQGVKLCSAHHSVDPQYHLRASSRPATVAAWFTRRQSD